VCGAAAPAAGPLRLAEPGAADARAANAASVSGENIGVAGADRWPSRPAPRLGVVSRGGPAPPTLSTALGVGAAPAAPLASSGLPAPLPIALRYFDDIFVSFLAEPGDFCWGGPMLPTAGRSSCSILPSNSTLAAGERARSTALSSGGTALRRTPSLASDNNDPDLPTRRLRVEPARSTAFSSRGKVQTHAGCGRACGLYRVLGQAWLNAQATIQATKLSLGKLG
jgi:hypothetical protein